MNENEKCHKRTTKHIFQCCYHAFWHQRSHFSVLLCTLLSFLNLPFFLTVVVGTVWFVIDVRYCVILRLIINLFSRQKMTLWEPQRTRLSSKMMIFVQYLHFFKLNIVCTQNKKWYEISFFCRFNKDPHCDIPYLFIQVKAKRLQK